MAKIINDPVHGFIQIKYDLAQRCIDHPYFQRLRHISQLGLTHFVYPGAHHSRFHHAIGAFHLMQMALANLKVKGVPISLEEEESACLAILLHDIGHGPFSHTLEHQLWTQTSHEKISLALMHRLNQQFEGKLSLAIQMFENKYSRRFFYQLISSQLDVDRLDYLKRDSFYSGVVEGNISVDRILAMIDVRDEQLVVEEKGVMSIQNYLLTRNLMYWQVYLHKTVMSAENMLINIFKRVHQLKNQAAIHNIADSTLKSFICSNSGNFESTLDQFILLDDSDVWQFIKGLKNSGDYVLEQLSTNLLNRNLYKVSSNVHSKALQIDLSDERDKCFFEFEQDVKITAYSSLNPIQILKKNGEIQPYEDFMTASGNLITDKNQASKKFYFQL
ncbi:MAG: HD domain-containing protein [Chitinophagales bacterium]